MPVQWVVFFQNQPCSVAYFFELTYLCHFYKLNWSTSKTPSDARILDISAIQADFQIFVTMVTRGGLRKISVTPLHFNPYPGDITTSG